MILMIDGSGTTSRDAADTRTMIGTMIVVPHIDGQDPITTMIGRKIMAVVFDTAMTMTDVGISALVLEAEHHRTAKSGNLDNTRVTSGKLLGRKV